MIRNSAWMFLLILTLNGCGGQGPDGKPRAALEQERREERREGERAEKGDALDKAPKISPAELYSLALSDAYRFMAERKHEDALVKFRAALEAQPNDYVKSEIARLEAIIKQKSIAEKTTADIRVILQAGKAEEASKLAADALLQFGDTDVAVTLADIKKEADAMIGAQLGDAAKQRFQTEALEALKASNLRGAIMAYDQAVANGVNDGDFKGKFEPYKQALMVYDENRNRGLEMRQDSSKLDLALASFTAAKEKWDTPQIRQDIQETQLAINNRRDSVAIGTFEVIGDVGIPQAGKAIAEELPAHFQAKFDVVERSRIDSVVAELKLDEGSWTNDQNASAQVGKLVKAKYLVVGSISRLAGLAVNARLVETNSGLVVQTAKIVAATPEELVKKLPELAKILMMSDQEKMAFEQECAKANTVEVAPVQAAIPEAPAVPVALDPNVPNAANANPVAVPDVVINAANPPATGAVTAAEMSALSAPPAPQQGAVVVLDAPNDMRQRSIYTSLQVGDSLYMQRRFVEAMRYYEFALSLAPDMPDIRIRIDNTRPFLPPPPPVPVVMAPRLAVLPFAEFGNPYAIPPGLGAWTAENLAWQFSGTYQIVDPGQVYWWMARLGMTVRDVATNPYARLCLARAMNVRFFLMGALQEAAGLDVSTNLLDVEANAQIGGARMHVQDQFELKYRMRELAQMTSMPPAQQVVFVQQQQFVQTRVVAAQVHIKSGKFDLAITTYKEVLVADPNNTQVIIYLQNAEYQQRQWELENARTQVLVVQQAQMQQSSQIQLNFAINIESRRKSVDTVSLTARENAQNQQYRLAAQQNLLGQARTYLRAQQYQAAQNAYQVAYNMSPNPAILEEMAAARTMAAQQTAQANAVFVAQQQAAQQRQQQALMVNISIQLQAQQRAQAQAAMAQRQQAIQRDNAEYTRNLQAGHQMQTAGNLKQALAFYQTAQRINPTLDANRLVNECTILIAQSQAAAKGEANLVAYKQQVAQEQARQAQLQAIAAQNQQKYQAALAQARAAQAAKNWAEAEARYNLAIQVMHTEEAAAGLRQARDERAKLTAVQDAQRKQQAAEAQKQAEVQKQMAAAKAAAAAGKHEQAVASLKQAAALNPQDKVVQAQLLQAEHAQQTARLDAAAKTNAAELEKKNKEAEAARIAQAKKEADARASRPAQPVSLNKEQEAAALAKRQAEEKQKAEIESRNRQDRQAKQEAENKQKLMMDGREAQAKREAEEKQKADEARKLQEKEAADAKRKADMAARDAQMKRDAELKADQERANKLAADKKAQELAAQQQMQKKNEEDKAKLAAQEQAKKQQEYIDEMKKGTDAYSKRQFDEAIAHFNEAMKAKPNDPTATAYIKQTQQTKQEFAKAQPPAQPAAQAGTMTPKADPKPPAADPKAEQFAQYMQQARALVAANRFPDANAYVAEALKIKPNDAEATKLQQQIQQSMQPKKDPPKDAPPAVDPKAAQYAQYMQQARALVAANRFPDANAYVAEALKIKPNDAEAVKLQQQIQQAMQPKATTPAPTAPPAQPNANAQLQQSVAAAQDAQRKGKYPEASQHYEAALKLSPNDANLRKLTDFCKLMVDGQRNRTAGKFADAQTDFTNALKLFPNDQDAKTELQKAKDKKKN